MITYGFCEDADVRATQYQQSAGMSSFMVEREGSAPLAISVNLPGEHNVLNALAGVAVAMDEGVTDHAIQDALQNFAGIGRRFESWQLYRQSRVKCC